MCRDTVTEDVNLNSIGLDIAQNPPKSTHGMHTLHVTSTNVQEM